MLTCEYCARQLQLVEADKNLVNANKDIFDFLDKVRGIGFKIRRESKKLDRLRVLSDFVGDALFSDKKYSEKDFERASGGFNEWTIEDGILNQENLVEELKGTKAMLLKDKSPHLLRAFRDRIKEYGYVIKKQIMDKNRLCGEESFIDYMTNKQNMGFLVDIESEKKDIETCRKILDGLLKGSGDNGYKIKEQEDNIIEGEARLLMLEKKQEEWNKDKYFWSKEGIREGRKARADYLRTKKELWAITDELNEARKVFKKTRKKAEKLKAKEYMEQIKEKYDVLFLEHDKLTRKWYYFKKYEKYWR